MHNIPLGPALLSIEIRWKGESVSLRSRLEAHDWTSAEPFDLLERLELIKELRAIPLKELAEVFKRIGSKLSAEISTLLNTLD